MSNDWTKKLRDRMTDYQEPVKDDLWAAIEQSLAQKPQDKTLGIRIFSFRRISIAAAIATLAVGGSYVFLHPWGENTDVQVASVLKKNAKDQSSFSQNVSGQKAETLLSESLRSKTASASLNEKRNLSTRKAPMASSDVLSLALAENEAMPLGQSVESASMNSPSQEDKKLLKTQANDEAKQQDRKPVRHKDLSGDLYAANYPTKRGKSQNSLAFNVYGENGFVGNGNSYNSAPFVSSDASADPMPPMLTSNNNEYTPVFDSKVVGLLAAQEYQQEAKHHLPVSVGIQVGFGIAPRLNLTTGVVYTKASSDFIMSAHQNETVTTQDLHYVGIPLNLSYEVWGTKQFHTYVTVGGEGAVNVKNNTKTDGVEVSSKRDRMQWSGKASVGAQLDIVPQLGIYVEPGAKYYFDNGSQIENTFKDKKLNFNFQFGLRWNVGK